MEGSQEAIFILLKAGMGNGTETCISSDVDWNFVFNVSEQQGVSPICVSGLQLLTHHKEVMALDKTAVLRARKVQWIANALSLVKQHERQKQSAALLANIYHSKRIRTVVLKGMSLASYYPNPNYRTCCDLDCFLYEDYEKGNETVESIGISVDRSHYKHSHFVYAGLNVENHRFCTGIRGKRWLKRFEKEIQTLLNDSGKEYIDNTYLEKPCLLFNMLFFIQHAHNHFLHEKITLRYLCDWAMLLKAADGSTLSEFWDICKRYGLSAFANSLSIICQEYLGADKIVTSKMRKQEEMLVNDVFSTQETCNHNDGKAFRRLLIKNELKAAWKYRYFSDQSLAVALLQQITGYLFDKEPSLD